jgi:hypothetical protein
MSTAVAKSGFREVQIEATVLGPCLHCGTGAEFWVEKECSPGVEHEPTFTRPLGVVSRWHKSPFVRFWWRITGLGRSS